MSRLIVFSDAHIHDYTTFSKPVKDRTIGSRAVICLDAVSQVLAEWQDGDHVLFTGDLFDDGSKLRPSLLIEVIELLSSCGVPKEYLLFMPGQHDYEGDYVMDNAVSVLMDTVTVLWEGYEEFPGFELVTVWNSKDVDHMVHMAHKGYERTDGSRPVFLAGHFLVDRLLQEIGMPILKNAVPLDRLPHFTASFIGDFHVPVDLKESDMFSVGGLLHKNFSDKNRPYGSCIIYDIPSGEWVRKSVNAPRFMEMTLEEFDGDRFSKEDYYKLIIKDTGDLATRIIPLKEEGFSVIPGFDRSVLTKKTEDKKDSKLKSDITSPGVVVDEWVEKVGKENLKPHWMDAKDYILQQVRGT